MKCNENEMWRKKANFHLINYSYIIHLSCIFCAFTLECKYILRLGLEREQKPAKQTFICVSVNLKQIIAWVYHNFFVSLLLLLALYWNSLLSLSTTECCCACCYFTRSLFAVFLFRVVSIPMVATDAKVHVNKSYCITSETNLTNGKWYVCCIFFLLLFFSLDQMQIAS